MFQDSRMLQSIVQLQMHWILEVIADTKRDAASVLAKEEDSSQPSHDSCPVIYPYFFTQEAG